MSARIIADWSAYIEFKDVLFLLIALAFLLSAPVSAWHTWSTGRTRRRGRVWRLSDIIYPFGAVIGGTIVLVMVYDDVRGRYLLREGAYRYAVAQVYKHSSQRGNRTFLYYYRVAGHKH